MISGRWGKPNEVLLDILAEPDGTVRGIVNPGRQHARIRQGRFDSTTGAVKLEGEHAASDGSIIQFHIEGRLDGHTLRLAYEFGEMHGEIAVVRVEEYMPPRLTLLNRLKPFAASLKRWMNSRTRPTRKENLQKLRERGESTDSIVFRDAVASDIAALAELHVATWNATYNVTRGPTVATRMSQWNEVFAQENRRDFILVLENRNGELIGFTWGKPNDGEFAGELSKIYLRWEYHQLGLGRRMMDETAKRFLARNIHSFVLFADIANPTLGFYDRMGGERLRDDRGQFSGGYMWRDVTQLITSR